MESIPILLVDDDTAIFEHEQTGWLERGTEIIQVESMHRAIEKLFHSGVTFLFAAINADNISWRPLMPVMREHSIIPIFMISAHFTVREQAEALRAGVDAFAPLLDNTQDNIELALAFLQRLDAQRDQADRPLVWRDLVIDATMHVATVKNKKLHLTPLNFSVLRFLALKRGRPASKEEIYARGWNEDNCMDVDGVVASQIHQLREELKNCAGDEEYIGNEWGIGYKMV